jgi:O-antigen ligase
MINITRTNGFLHWVLPAMLALLGLAVLLSGRDLALVFMELQSGEGYGGPAVVWGQRLVSVLLLAAAGERVVSHVAQHKQLPSPGLTLAFVVYWFATVAGPAFFGSHPRLAHEYLYTLVLGFAVLLVNADQRDQIVDATRNALVVFVAAGLLLIPVLPSLVMDMSYRQGLFPGVPRFGGLAPHAVAMGMFAQTALLLIWARPFRLGWLNVLAWLASLAALFLAQSKTAWIAFLLCSACMLAVRNGPGLWRRVTDPRQGAFGMTVCLLVIVAMLAALTWVVVGDLETRVSNFADTAQGAQLISMTGRDKIWAIAMEEWQQSPVFGYGPGLWDWDFRASIGMPNATDAHNQFMDTLARSGSVGAAALIVYAGVLLFLSIRHARATGGLSLALFLALALRSISEVPLLLFGYGTELFPHLLLLVTLAGAASTRARVVTARTPYGYGVAS